MLANQSLNLSKSAADDFAERGWIELAPVIGTSAQQTTWRLFAGVGWFRSVRMHEIVYYNIEYL